MKEGKGAAGKGRKVKERNEYTQGQSSDVDEAKKQGLAKDCSCGMFMGGNQDEA